MRQSDCPLQLESLTERFDSFSLIYDRFWQRAGSNGT